MIDACSQEAKPLLSLNEALERIKAAIHPVNGTEKVMLKNALGRVLAEPVYSPINIPHDRNAAMDGYAFASRDMTQKQAFTLSFGRHFLGRTTISRATEAGAMRSDFYRRGSAGQALIQSSCRNMCRFRSKPYIFRRTHEHIKISGRLEKMLNKGACLIAHPKILTAVDLGLLASAGIGNVTVRRPIKIAYFSTGDELTSLGQPLESGKIYDSNRTMLGGLLADPCYSVVDLGVIPDNKQMLEDSFIEASKNYDVIITTGGASVGEADYVKEILQSCGEVNFWKIAIKPGKPLAFGKIGQCYFFGLPGNPVAVVVTFQQIVAPALRQLSGAPYSKPLRFTATCTSALKKAPGRQEFQRGILRQDDNGEFFVASAGQQGSHILSSMSQAIAISSYRKSAKVCKQVTR